MPGDTQLARGAADGYHPTSIECGRRRPGVGSGSHIGDGESPVAARLLRRSGPWKDVTTQRLRAAAARQQSSSTSTHCTPTSRVPRQKMTIMSRQADGRLLLAALRHKVWPLIAFDARTITKAEREQILDYDPATGVSHNPRPGPRGLKLRCPAWEVLSLTQHAPD